MRDPDQDEGPQGKGGRAAERLRQFLAERFGDEAPVIPPDQEESSEEEPTPEPRDDTVNPDR